MHDGADPMDCLRHIGHLCDVSLDDLNSRLTLQSGKIADRQIKNTHGMPISPAAGPEPAAHAASSTRDENRAAHVMVVPSILALVPSAFVAFSSFSTAAGRLAHFWSATSPATATASVLHAFVGGTLIIVLMKNLSLTSLREARTLSRTPRAWAASAALAVATAVLAC